MKKLLITSLAAVSVAGLIGGGTFAAWNDTDSIVNNTTAAGHLVLDVDSTGTISNVGGNSIAPGENRTIDFFVASADLDGVPLADLSMTISGLEDYENGCLDPETDAGDTSCGGGVTDGEFSRDAYVRVRYTDPAPLSDITFAGNNCSSAGGGYVNSVGYTPANDNDATVYPRLATIGGPNALAQLAGNEGICVRIDLGLDVNAANDVMSDSSVFDLDFDLVQS